MTVLISRRTAMGATASAFIVSSANAADEDGALDALIADHHAAELAAYHEDDGGDEAIALEEASRRRLLRHPVDPDGFVRKVFHLGATALDGVGAEPWGVKLLVDSCVQARQTT